MLLLIDCQSIANRKKIAGANKDTWTEYYVSTYITHLHDNTELQTVHGENNMQVRWVVSQKTYGQGNKDFFSHCRKDEISTRGMLAEMN